MGQLKTATVKKDEFDWKALRYKFEKPNLKYMLEDEADWFGLIHGETDDNRFIPFLFIPVERTENDRTITLSYKKKDITNSLIQSLVNNAYDLKYNMYMSPTCLFSPERKAENAWNTNTIILDLDYYNTEYKDLNPYELISKMNFKGAYPSIIASSGNGVYLVYKLSEKQALGTAAAAGLMNTVKNALIENFAEFGCDSKCSDPARVFRMIGTRNFKKDTVKQSYIIEQNKKTYDIMELLEVFEKPVPQRVIKKTVEPIEKTINTKQNGFGAVVATNYYRFFKLAEDRLEDLAKLFELRGGDFGTGEKDDKTSCRNEFLFMVAVHSFYAMSDIITTWNLVELYNSKLTSPLELADIDVIVNSANDNNEERLKCQELAEQLKRRIQCGEKVSKAETEKTHKYYRYKNSTICKNLFITNEEGQYMKQLLTDVVKKDRKDARNKAYYAKQQQQKKANKEDKNEKELIAVSIMINQGLTIKQMAEKLNCSESKIKQLKKKVKDLTK